MVKTIEVARDMIRILEENVNNCDSRVPLMISRSINRVDEAYDQKEIDWQTMMNEKVRIEKLADKFHKNCSCLPFRQ